MERNIKKEYQKLALIFGLIYGLMGVVLSVTLYMMDRHLDQPAWAHILKIIIGASIVFYAIFQYRKKLNGFINVEQAIKLGVAVSLIAGIVEATSNYIYLSQIEKPEAKEKMLVETKKQFEEQYPDSSEEKIEEGVGTTKKFMEPVTRGAFGTMWMVFIGLIYSLIAGLILQRHKPSMQQQNPTQH